MGKQPVSHNCTVQTNISMTRKAWEDILQSPQVAKSSPKAAGTKTEGNKENKTSGKPVARPRSADVPDESSSGKSQKAATSPRRQSTGTTTTARKGSAVDDAAYDADRFEVDEVEEDEELVRSLGSKNRPGFFDAGHEDEHSIEEDDRHGGHDATAVPSADDRPRNPTSTLRPKKQATKKVSPPKENSTAKMRAQTQTQTQKMASSSGPEMWFKLAPKKASAGARPSDRYEHPVREEPLPGAEEVGYLVPGLAVLAQAVVGEWAKVRYHKKRAVLGKVRDSTLCACTALRPLTSFSATLVAGTGRCEHAAVGRLGVVLDEGPSHRGAAPDAHRRRRRRRGGGGRRGEGGGHEPRLQRLPRQQRAYGH